MLFKHLYKKTKYKLNPKYQLLGIGVNIECYNVPTHPPPLLLKKNILLNLPKHITGEIIGQKDELTTNA